jgi:hypothetical protein
MGRGGTMLTGGMKVAAMVGSMFTAQALTMYMIPGLYESLAGIVSGDETEEELDKSLARDGKSGSEAKAMKETIQAGKTQAEKTKETITLNRFVVRFFTDLFISGRGNITESAIDMLAFNAEKAIREETNTRVPQGQNLFYEPRFSDALGGYAFPYEFIAEAPNIQVTYDKLVKAGGNPEEALGISFGNYLAKIGYIPFAPEVRNIFIKPYLDPLNKLYPATPRFEFSERLIKTQASTRANNDIKAILSAYDDADMTVEQKARAIEKDIREMVRGYLSSRQSQREGLQFSREYSRYVEELLRDRTYIRRLLSESRKSLREEAKKEKLEQSRREYDEKNN